MVKDGSLFRLDGKIVVVIGAGSGIGAAAAIGCAGQGARVICLDIDEESAASTAKRIGQHGSDSESAQLDIRNREAVGTSFDRIRANYGRIDVVICTPSINVRKTILDYQPDELDRVIDVNLKGSFHVLQAAGKAMVGEGQGSIILFSSIRSLVVEPGQGVYAATKAGIIQMVRALAAELGTSGVRVNAIAPGVVDTPLTAPIKSQPDWYQAYADKNIMKRWAHVDEMIGPTVFLASDASSYMTGSVLFVDGGWTAVDGRFQPPGM